MTCEENKWELYILLHKPTCTLTFE